MGYFLWTEVFSPESTITYFNRAVDRIRKDDRLLELLGDSKKITAHGEETHNRWKRSRPISSTESKDRQGNQHLVMQFYVSCSAQSMSESMLMIIRSRVHVTKDQYLCT